METASVIEKDIPYDRMKEQVAKELLLFIDGMNSREDIPLPHITFEKGYTRIEFPLPHLGESLLLNFMAILRDHLENLRVHAFGEGYYAFQALNGNLFKTDNILDNIKVEFTGLSANFRTEITKKGNLTQEEINLTVGIFRAAYGSMKEDPASRLKKLGASVYDGGSFDWSYIAGYEEVKRKIRESIILPLKNPDIYDSIARITRKTYETNRPRAILFEGPPGVGKTTVARIISGEVSVPLIYVPIESIISKWYGQSSQNLAHIFDAAEDMGGAILFLDEIDALAGSRDQNMFEATRRVLSVLLRKLDGIDSVKTTITIGATNRKADLDRALLSRFEQSIRFPLPSAAERASIFRNYASHLSEQETEELAVMSGELPGRTIKDICEMTERRWARKLIIKNMEASSPPFELYKQSARAWMSEAGESG